jgi:hypothetical protein
MRWGCISNERYAHVPEISTGAGWEAGANRGAASLRLSHPLCSMCLVGLGGRTMGRAIHRPFCNKLLYVTRDSSAAFTVQMHQTLIRAVQCTVTTFHSRVTFHTCRETPSISVQSSPRFFCNIIYYICFYMPNTGVIGSRDEVWWWSLPCEYVFLGSITLFGRTYLYFAHFYAQKTLFYCIYKTFS